MEWMGLIALVLVLCYSSYPGKVKHLGSAVKRLERKQRGEDKTMSKLIQELVNEECIIKSDAALQFVGSDELECKILDVDDEWMKIYFTDKKGNPVIKLLRIENIDEIEMLSSDQEE